MATVLITGASRGIGFETALAFGRGGDKVHATMRNPSQSTELSRIADREKLRVTVSALDVDSDESVHRAIEAIHAEDGAVDVLVNNAGIERSGSIEELPQREFRAAMETNYFGPLRCIQAVVPHMRQRHSGCIINVTSVAGRIACPPLTPYMASKWALEALSESLAAEMKTFGVRVLIVEPGIIDTAMSRRITEQPARSPYRQHSRFARLFETSLKSPVPPALVAQKIVEVANDGTWQLRHPVGPDAGPFLQWRGQFKDEDWIDLNSADDETWYAQVERDFDMDTRPAR